MTGENLFDESRARSRQPDDEDRIGIRTTTPADSREEFGVEISRDSPALGFKGRTVERRFPVPEFVSRRVMFKCPICFPALLPRPTQCKMQAGLIDGTAGTGGDRRLHGTNFRIAESVGLEVRKAPVRLSRGRICADALLIRPFALRSAPKGFEHIATRQLKTLQFGIGTCSRV